MAEIWRVMGMLAGVFHFQPSEIDALAPWQFLAWVRQAQAFSAHQGGVM